MRDPQDSPKGPNPPTQPNPNNPSPFPTPPPPQPAIITHGAMSAQSDEIFAEMRDLFIGRKLVDLTRNEAFTTWLFEGNLAYKVSR